MAWKGYNKYGNHRFKTVDGWFDSEHEYSRWCELKIMQKHGYISDLERQVKYELIPSQRDEDGKSVELPCNYVADFRYKDNKTGEIVVEDAKGFKTDAYVIKRKAMLYKYGIRIREV